MVCHKKRNMESGPTTRYAEHVDQAFRDFRLALAAHHALGHVNLSDGLSLNSVLDDNSGAHNVLSGYSSRCEMHWNPHTLSKKRRLEYEQQLQQANGEFTALAETEDGAEVREKRYEIAGKVVGLANATASPCDIRPLAVRRGNYYGTGFYLEIPNADGGGVGVQHVKMFNGSLFAPLPHVYRVHVEVGEMERNAFNGGGRETVVVVRDLLSKSVDAQFVASLEGLWNVLSYVLGLPVAEVGDILDAGNYRSRPLSSLGVEPRDQEERAILDTEALYEVHKEVCKALALYDYRATNGEADTKYQQACSELHFGRTAFDERYRRQETEFKNNELYDMAKRKMPPTKLALFCRHPETLHVFGAEYLRFLGGCEADGRGPFFSMDFLQGLNLTTLRELYWYVRNHPRLRPLLFSPDDRPDDRLHLSPTQRLFFFTQFGPRAPPQPDGSGPSEAQEALHSDPAHPDFYDLRLVSMPHLYTRRRAVLPMDELWAEYLFYLEPDKCASAGYDAPLFGMCVLLYGLMKRAHYTDKNTCLPRSHLRARMLDALGGSFGNMENVRMIDGHSSRLSRVGRKNRMAREEMTAKITQWLRRALGPRYKDVQDIFYDKVKTLFEPALELLVNPERLGVLVEEHEPDVNEPIYYLMQPYMFERTIVHALEHHARRFEYYRRFQDDLYRQELVPTEKVVVMNPLVEATVWRGWKRTIVAAVAAAVQSHASLLEAQARANMDIKMENESMMREYMQENGVSEDEALMDLAEDFRPLQEEHGFGFDTCRTTCAELWQEMPELHDEVQWYYERYNPQNSLELERMGYFGPVGAEIPPTLHPPCSEQLATFEAFSRSPIMCINGQAGSGKSDLGMLMFAGAAQSFEVDNVVGLAFMSAHCSTWQQKMATDHGVRYPVMTVHQFMEWHSKTCTLHPGMPPELQLKARAMWKHVAKEDIPFFGAAARNGHCQNCLLERLHVVMIDEAGLLYDELMAQLQNILCRCADHLVNQTFIGDVNQLDPVQPGHPFFQLVAAGLWNFFMQHSHRSELLETVQMSRQVGTGEVHPRQWNNGKTTHFIECSTSETSVRQPYSMLTRLMCAFTAFKLTYRDTMVTCHTNAECRQIATELDTHYLGSRAFKLGGNEGRANFNNLALSSVTKKIKQRTYFPGQLVLMKKHIPALNVCTNEILLVHDVIIGRYVRLPYPVVSQMRLDLWNMIMDAVEQGTQDMHAWPQVVRETFEEATRRMMAWTESAAKDREQSKSRKHVEITPVPDASDDPLMSEDANLVAAIKGRYRVLLSSVQREHATAQCREAWQHWLLATSLYKKQPQQVLAVERSREMPGDWPPDGHSSVHWHPACYAQRERRDFSHLVDFNNNTTDTDDNAFPGDWALSLQGVDMLMDQLRRVVGAPSDSMLYRMVCETAVELLLGLRHDLGLEGDRDTNPVPHLNPLLRVSVNPNFQPPGARPPPPSVAIPSAEAEQESYEPLDAEPKKHTCWWRAETRSEEERQFIEQCRPSARAVAMAVGEHEQTMRERTQELIQMHHANGGTPQTLVLPDHLAEFADDRNSTMDENDFVAFEPVWRAAHSRVQVPSEEGKTLRFLRCVVRSSYGKLTRHSVVFIPCCDQFERYLRPASAVTFYACQSKQVQDVIFAARYRQDLPTLYTAFTRTERRFFAVAGPTVLEESLKCPAVPRISYMHRKLRRLAGSLYKSCTDSREMQEALTAARHRQHEHSELADARQRLCFERQTPIEGLDEAGHYSLGKARDAWLKNAK